MLRTWLENTNQSSLLKNKNMSVSCSAKLKREDLIFRIIVIRQKNKKTLWLLVKIRIC